MLFMLPMSFSEQLFFHLLFCLFFSCQWRALPFEQKREYDERATKLNEEAKRAAEIAEDTEPVSSK